MQMKDGVQVNDDVGLEREADVMGRKATQISDTRHLRPHSALPSSRAKRKNSGILLQRKIYIYKDDKGVPKVIANFDSFKNTETPECMAILKTLHDQKEYYSIDDALEIARKQSVQNLMATPSVLATNSAAAPLASAVPPPSIPDQKLHKPVVINIKSSSAHGDNKNQKQPYTARRKPPTEEEQVNAIIFDMNEQYNAWDGSPQRRGAWWGAKTVGSPEGAKRVPPELVTKLKSKLDRKNGWWFTTSDSGDLSFHKSWRGVVFIYHMNPPHKTPLL